MHIQRHMESVVTELTQQYPAIMVVGPHQVGKTTTDRPCSEGPVLSSVWPISWVRLTGAT